MKALMKKKPAPGAELSEAEKPAAGPNDVLVKVKATSICGTDDHIFQWNKWAESRIKPPMIFGHELCGDVVEKGEKVENLEIGDFISAETHIYCGKCFQCRTGNAHICEKRKILGVDIDGGFADYVVIPKQNAWKNDKSLAPEIASIQEPFGNAVHTVFSGEIKGKNVLITGAGAIGLFAIAICRAEGASKIFVKEPVEYRQKLAEKAGADFVFDPLKEKPTSKAILSETRGKGVDVLLEMSGKAKALTQGLRLLRDGGRASILGVFPGPVKIDVSNDVVFKYATIRGINGRKIWGSWEKTAELLKSGKVNVDPIITHKIKLEEFEKGFELMASGECGKIVMFP